MLRRGVQSGARPLNTTLCGDRCTDELPLCKEGRYVTLGEVLAFNRSSTGEYYCADALCADVAEYCHSSSEAGIRARMLCPKTCGCDNPRSPLALSLPSMGCPERCDRTAEYKVALAPIPCEDISTDNPLIREFLNNMFFASDTWPQDWRLGGQDWGRIISELGCSYFARTTPYLNITRPRSLPILGAASTCASGAAASSHSRESRFSAPSRVVAEPATTIAPTRAPPVGSSPGTRRPAWSTIAISSPTISCLRRASMDTSRRREPAIDDDVDDDVDGYVAPP